MDESLKLKFIENKSALAESRRKMVIIEKSLKVPEKLARIKEIEELETQQEYWSDNTKMTKLQKEKSLLRSVVSEYQELLKMIENYEVLEDFAINEGDEESAHEAIALFQQVPPLSEILEQKALLSGEVDANNAIVSINAGAGGTESCDWAMILARMLMKWSEKRRFKLTNLDLQEGETAGIKSTTFLVEGDFAFGLLKSESGIHRLVRISPFDSNARRHTSFASVFVSPEIDDTIEIEILDKDLRIDVYRSGGAGGQSVNTTDSAVRITHLPTNLVVTCQNERSQLQNKLFAMKVLRSRLYERELEERRQKQQQIEGEKRENSWGSQIRSYVLHPYKMIKDHRTGFEVGTPEKTLDGDLDGFMKAFLEWNSTGRRNIREAQLQID